LKNQNPIKRKETVSDFEKKANMMLIIVTIVIFSAIGLGVYLTMQKPVEKSAKSLQTIQKAQSNTTNSQKSSQTTKTEQKVVQSKVVEPTKTQENQKKESTDLSKQETIMVNIKTSAGDIEIALYPKLMPITVDNFVQLVKKNFYDGLNFHRVEDWVIQGGDPKGNGTGGSDKTIKLETNPNLKNVRGAIAMARSSDPDSASSQFYILKKDAAWLDNDYAVFGKVVSGMEVVDKIKKGEKIVEVKVAK